MYQRFFILLALLILLVSTGCASSDPTPMAEAVVEPTATIEPTETAVSPTETATSTVTQTAEPTATATNMSTPTATATNTATPSPEPTETPVPTQTAVPLPTQTAVPAPPVTQPATGSPPSGPNLAANPGFEYGQDGWNFRGVSMHDYSSQPNFIHSGSHSADTNYAVQTINNVQPGINYRVGAWVKIWSSDGENRELSENPGDTKVKICIDAGSGDQDLRLPTVICSALYQPFDTWQYITVDGVLISDRISVFLVGYRSETNLHTAILWDDASVGLSPVNAVATATPPPLGEPGSPAPMPFNAQSARDNMNNSRSMLEQMGGLLDRLVAGSSETCDEYTGYYRGLVASARYDGVPAEWQGIYNEYIFAVEHGSATNHAIFSTCFGGNGRVSELNYGVARDGINVSLNRLIPAVDAANGMP